MSLTGSPPTCSIRFEAGASSGQQMLSLNQLCHDLFPFILSLNFLMIFLGAEAGGDRGCSSPLLFCHCP